MSDCLQCYSYHYRFLLVALSHMYQMHIIAVLASTDLIPLSSDPYINRLSCNPCDPVCKSLYQQGDKPYVACSHMCVGMNFLVRDIYLCLLCDGFFWLEK